MEYIGWIAFFMALSAEYYLVYSYLPQYRTEINKYKKEVEQLRIEVIKKHEAITRLFPDITDPDMIFNPLYSSDREKFITSIHKHVMPLIEDIYKEELAKGFVQCDMIALVEKHILSSVDHKLHDNSKKIEYMSNKLNLLEKDVEFINVISGRNKYKE